MTEPGDQLNPRAAGNGHILASHTDREQVVGMLKTAFVRGMLTKGEFDSRVAAALASRTWADLAGLTADLPRMLPDSGRPPPRAELPAISRVTLLTSAVLIAAPLFFAVGLAGDKAGVVGALFIAVFLLILGALAGGLVASVIAAAVKAESRHRSRSRRRPPTGPGGGGRGAEPWTQHRQVKRSPRNLPWSECRT